MTIRKNSVLSGEAADLNAKVMVAVSLARAVGISAKWGTVRDSNGRFLALKISEGLTPEDAVRELARSLGLGGKDGKAPPETKSSKWARVAIGAGGGFLVGGPPGAVIGGVAGYALSRKGNDEKKSGTGSGTGITVGGVTLPPGSEEAPNIPGVDYSNAKDNPDKLVLLAGAGGSIGAIFGGVGAPVGAAIGAAIGGIWDLLEKAGPFFDWGRVEEIGLAVLHPSKHPTARRPQDLHSIAPNLYIWRVVKGTSGDGSQSILISALVSLKDAQQGRSVSGPIDPEWGGANRARIWWSGPQGGIVGNADLKLNHAASFESALEWWGVTKWTSMGIEPPVY